MNEFMKSLPEEFRYSFSGGMKVMVSDLAMRSEQVKRHTHRRGQSIAYHRRIDKKWRKRFGMKMVPAAYALAGGSTLVVHPVIYAEMRKRMQEEETRKAMALATFMRSTVAMKNPLGIVTILGS